MTCPCPRPAVLIPPSARLGFAAESPTASGPAAPTPLAAHDAHIVAFAAFYGEPWPINEQRLMEAVYGLPREKAFYEGDDKKAAEALPIFSALHDALRAFIAATRRDTIGTVRKDLRRIGRALTELQGAWAAASRRTVETIHAARGEPFEGVEARPLSESVEPFAAIDRGAYRDSRFREETADVARIVAHLAAEAETADQDRRQPTPGLDILIDRLAAIFVTHTRLALSTSRNDEGALGWIQSVVETLPARYQPSADMVMHAVRDAIERASSE